MMDLEEARRLVEVAKENGWLKVPEQKPFCRHCGYVQTEIAFVCNRCGELLRKKTDETS